MKTGFKFLGKREVKEQVSKDCMLDKEYKGRTRKRWIKNIIRENIVLISFIVALIMSVANVFLFLLINNTILVFIIQVIIVFGLPLFLWLIEGSDFLC
jgi:hypothetical protein